MCGIVGIVGTQPVAGRLVDALKRLEYRGYDSAGVATIHDGVMDRRRAEGKLFNLEKRLDTEPLPGTVGIAHTRWATHGVPNETNAHPHFVEGVAVVHNGIIENFSELRDELTEEGSVFETQTDTEVVAHLMAKYLREGLEPRAAMLKMLNRVTGAYALAVMLKADPGTIMAARSGPPLAVGYGRGEMFLGSDAIALSPFTNEISYLVDGDCAVLTRDGVSVLDFAGKPVKRARQISQATAYVVDKGNHRHFMEKEIYEQPEVISHALSHYVDFAANTIGANAAAIDFKATTGLAISACGTAYLAGLVGKYWFERYARLPVEIDVASEFRYREMPLSPSQAALFISQSGETADTLASLRYCRDNGLKIGAVVNVRESTIARESDAVFPIMAGPEIGVASTKAFTCQLAVLASLAIGAGKARGTVSAEEERALVRHLAEMPRIMSRVLNLIQPQMESLSRELSKCKDVLYLGRGTSFPLAMEGALKLKEISYIHAEAYPAGELKHGPLALVTDEMPVVTIAPNDALLEKLKSNMQEVRARGGQLYVFADVDSRITSGDGLHVIRLPEHYGQLSPILHVVALQLLAYHTALARGTDVDKPRNLAKSVTVE